MSVSMKRTRLNDRNLKVLGIVGPVVCKCAYARPTQWRLALIREI